MDAVTIALISTATAVAGGAITKAFDTWLGGRAKVSEELREHRLRVYAPVWERTKTLSMWPRTDATFDDLRRLHRDLRRWYYEVGGIYLSENAKDRYGELQGLIAAYVNERVDGPDERLPNHPDYDDLMAACSAFRTAITEDLESRRQRSLIWSISRFRVHRKQRKEAKQRAARAPEVKVHRERVELHHAAVDEPPERDSPIETIRVARSADSEAPAPLRETASAT